MYNSTFEKRNYLNIHNYNISYEAMFGNFISSNSLSPRIWMKALKVKRALHIEFRQT